MIASISRSDSSLGLNLLGSSVTLKSSPCLAATGEEGILPVEKLLANEGAAAEAWKNELGSFWVGDWGCGLGVWSMDVGKVLLPKNLIKGVLRVARVGFMVNRDE